MADVSTSDRYERGLKKMSEVYGVDGGEVVAPLRDLGRYMVEFPYGDIYSRDGLALRGREPQLRVHFHAALNVGLTADELEEIIIHTIIFAGFPTAINALNLLH